MFARLHRCSGLVEAARIYMSIYICFLIRQSTPEVVAAQLNILPAAESEVFQEMSEIDVTSLQTLNRNVMTTGQTAPFRKFSFSLK